jgi:hypothetical protein
MALAYATVVRKFEAGIGVAHEIAKADTGDSATDALAFYRKEFQAMGWDNSRSGRRTLRHVFNFLLGLGMCESSGEHCCGRDTSAGESSQSSDTCEAGLFQQSWNSNSCCTDIEELLEEYRGGIEDETPPAQCQLTAFAREVECGADDWDNYGSGTGAEFQALCKQCPAFAVEAAAVGIRNLRQHWGPIGRREVELAQEANTLFAEIDDILATSASV